MKVFHKSVKGLYSRKAANEDCILTYTPTHTDLHEKPLLISICDGLGGMKAGDVASRTCCQEFKNYMSLFAKYEDKADFMADMILTANKQLYIKQKSNQSLNGMATTAVSALIHRNIAYVTSVGDSRLYLFRNNKLLQITEDDSLVWEMYQRNMLTKDQLIKHPQGHILTNAIGSRSYIEIKPVIPLPLEPRDYLLLTSDGIHDYLTDSDIEKIMRSDSDTQEYSDMLINEARSKKSLDDISIILVSIC